MATFRYRCVSCGHPRTFLRATVSGVRPDELVCTCGGRRERVEEGPSVHAVERLDNGLMPRALERYADAPRLFQERHDAHRREVLGEDKKETI